MLSCDTHFHMCNIELRESYGVSTNVVGNWETTDINVQVENKMAF